MTSAAGASRIPHKHSTTLSRQGTRSATSHSHVPDVTSSEHRLHSSGSERRSRHPDPNNDNLAATTAKSRSHSRLASLGRIRSRGSIQQREPLPALAPVSSTDVGSRHKPSDTSTLSNSSSETTLSDDSKSDAKSIQERRPSRPSFWLASSNVPGDFARDRHTPSADTENHHRSVQRNPRMMHQTSSKLLRMTEDDRPFTRVCTAPPFAFYATAPHLHLSLNYW